MTLDIDDTVDVVHGDQQLSLFNAHYDERCFLPIHIYDTATSRPVAVPLRPGKTPSGIEIRGHLRRLGPPHTKALAGDAYHHPRRRSLRPPGGHAVVRREWHPLHLRSARQRRARPAGLSDGRRHSDPPRARPEPRLRGFAETSYQAKSWNTDRRACARIEATTKGLDIRFVVTSIETGSTEHMYKTLYCARGQAENPGLRRGRL